MGISNFAMQKCADENSNSFSQQVVNTIMYCLASVPYEFEAIALYHDLWAICARGGFQLKKWISNSQNVLAAIPKEERAVDVKEDGSEPWLISYWEHFGSAMVCSVTCIQVQDFSPRLTFDL